MLTVRNIHKHFGDQQILNDVSFEIKGQDRIGLVGINGAGKSTLANLIYGRMEPDSGTIVKAPSLKIGYLKQSVDFQSAEISHPSSEFLEKTSELGLSKYQSWDHDRLSHLSGGEKLKIALAEVWSCHPHILLLDEPTNHLDFQGINWLIEQLKTFKGAIVVISHDRYFLDQIAGQIFDLENGHLTTYEGNYTSYFNEKKKRREVQLHHYHSQQKDIARVEAQMEQLQHWAGKAHRTMRDQEGMKEFHGVKAKKIDRAMKSKMKRLKSELEKNKVEKPSEEKNIAFQFKANEKRGNRIIEAKDLMKKFQTRMLFQQSHFYIKHGEKIGMYGPNGSGKTTLINMLRGKETITSGYLNISSSLNIASLSQDVADMDISQTGLDALQISDRTQLLKARTTLANMGMDAEKLSQRVGTLSLGERTRIKLTNMLINEYDLLILDEPTNHLDLASRNQLEKTLKDFSGTILIVSHDIYFLQHVCDKLLVFEDKKIKRVEMTIEEYEKKRTTPQKSISSTQKEIEEELLRVNTEISAVLGELSLLTPDSDKYTILDQKFLNLTKKKQDLLTKAQAT
ncbi:ribosomal protection-like ABC-F family protein [Metabacillus halosaccharovorans]|uniref:ribosomal protection-like ABC-F family protein n=1 Tax=Metabacillus halosaccharovorans TaxID=930124 RepID=UPI00203C523E|nr:ABC-F type ribosomal protection protein [Metabacillus halosaccharovorans]MCM3441695.1 ABC-F type ribosomal protection protein [Metabacillus halosaccharovorans]